MDPGLETLLRLPRPDHADDEASFVLIHAVSTGRRPLDLKLIGTDQETVFALALKHSHIASLKSKNSPGNQEEWEARLLFVLRGAGAVPETAKAGQGVANGVEAIAKVEKNSTALTITVQKRIQGITQKLGTLFLPATEDEEVSLYDWCGSAVIAKQNADQELQTAQASVGAKDEQIKKLEQSLDELVHLKNDHEKALLEKFSLLLNEKKLKIRDQQRLLAGSNLDTANLEKGPRTKNTSARSAGPSRAAKRKIGEDTQALKDNGPDDEPMDIDNEGEQADAIDSDEGETRTPDPESTASEAESEADAPPNPGRPKRTIGGPKNVSKDKTPDPSQSSQKDVSPPPPKRDLPFQQQKAAKPAPPVDGSETESDEEL